MSDDARPSRRTFLGGAALGAAGLTGAGVAAGLGIHAATRPAVEAARHAQPEPAAAAAPAPPVAAEDRTVPFYGEHQAGVTTPQQDRMMFAALDVTTTDPMELQRLLGRWAAMAARFAEGKPVSESRGKPLAPPFDTGETEDLGASSLTVTVGFGASLFDDRYGLAPFLPAALQPLGVVPGDTTLRPAWTGGDLCIQACADDPQVVFHAVRNMVRAARGTAVLRWSQLGFGRASATSSAQVTPRNLMGFRDGTNNLHVEDVAAVNEQVWVGPDTDQGWMQGGTYLVARKIRMEIESWDTDDLADQERIFGRFKSSGGPLTGGGEFTAVDYDAHDTDDRPVIDLNSHIRLSAPENNNGVTLLRRGYNYTDGQDPETGKMAAGLFFICFQTDPHRQFKVIQSRLGSTDLLNEYIAHIGGGVWACPPGLSGPGDWFGKGLFAQES